jgi:ABC-2 type transport system ATP-binding protein
MAMIEADNLSKRFGTKVAVDGVSFTISAGDVVGFLGPNGAGKSTTMRLLTGFLDPDTGAARIHGYEVRTARQAAQSRVGYLPEAAGGFPNLTVREFLVFCGETRGLCGRPLDDAIARTSHLISLDGALDSTMKSLSKGWRQRAWLAQAIVHDPPVLILDEPTDGLDPIQKQQIRKLIKTISPKKAIILSTHILEEAEEVCNRAIIIAEGRIVADDTPENLADGGGRISTAFLELATVHQ